MTVLEGQGGVVMSGAAHAPSRICPSHLLPSATLAGSAVENNTTRRMI